MRYCLLAILLLLLPAFLTNTSAQKDEPKEETPQATKDAIASLKVARDKSKDEAERLRLDLAIDALTSLPKKVVPLKIGGNTTFLDGDYAYTVTKVEASKEGVAITFTVKNQSDTKVLESRPVSPRLRNIIAKDDTGRVYPIGGGKYSGGTKIPPQTSVQWVQGFVGGPLPAAKELIFDIKADPEQPLIRLTAPLSLVERKKK